MRLTLKKYVRIGAVPISPTPTDYLRESQGLGYIRGITCPFSCCGRFPKDVVAHIGICVAGSSAPKIFLDYFSSTWRAEWRVLPMFWHIAWGSVSVCCRFRRPLCGCLAKFALGVFEHCHTQGAKPNCRWVKTTAAPGPPRLGRRAWTPVILGPGKGSARGHSATTVSPEQNHTSPTKFPTKFH